MTAKTYNALPIPNLALASGDRLTLTAVIHGGQVVVQRIAVTYADPSGGKPVSTTFTFPDTCPRCGASDPCPECDPNSWTPDP